MSFATLVVTTFNHSSSIRQVIKTALVSETLIRQVIVVDDASGDNTADLAEDLLDKLTSIGRLEDSLVMKNRISKFETYCDDSGVRKAKHDLVLLLQGDMLLRDENFVDRACNYLEKYENLFLISGRGTHSKTEILQDLNLHGPSSSTSSLISTLLSPLKFASKGTFGLRRNRAPREPEPIQPSPIFPTMNEFRDTARAGQLGNLFDHPLEASQVAANNRLWSSHLVFRGPLIFSKARFLELGGLDKRRFFLGFDDHDLSARAWMEKKWMSGYLPCVTEQILEAGATRRPRKLFQQLNFRMRRASRRQKFQQSSLSRFLSLPENQLPEVHIFDLN